MNSKKNYGYVWQYEHSKSLILSDCYERYSEKKRNIFTLCVNKMIAQNGHDLRILSFNVYYFTIAYVVDDDLIVNTDRNEFIIKNYKEI